MTIIPGFRSQLEHELDHPPLRADDRNLDKGGRSFYFFDFDDNILNLSTKIYIYEKDTGKEIEISSTVLAEEGPNIGKTGKYENYKFNYDDRVGSFRNFRDIDLNYIQKIAGKRQIFVKDVVEAIDSASSFWKGPSWDYFRYACYNQRPISIITARGHEPETIKEGIKVLYRKKQIPCVPNYLCVFPLANAGTRMMFGDPNYTVSSAGMKKLAIQRSVEMAIHKYGKSPYHRFGMSDDSPENIALITEAMYILKSKYPKMSFFVIDTSQKKCIKKEVTDGRIVQKEIFEGELTESELEDVTTA